MKTTTAQPMTTIEMLDLLGDAWQVTLTCLEGNDRWQLRIASHPAPRWNESFSYTYRGALADVVKRAYEGDTDDGELCGDCDTLVSSCLSGGAGGCYDGCAPPAEVTTVRGSL